MKTKAIKFVIPALAIVFAIATSAFTSLNTTEDKDATTIIGYVHTPDPCTQVRVDCSPTGEEQCESDGNYVYDMNNNGTACDVPLFKNQS